MLPPGAGQARNKARAHRVENDYKIDLNGDGPRLAARTQRLPEFRDYYVGLQADQLLLRLCASDRCCREPNAPPSAGCGRQSSPNCESSCVKSPRATTAPPGLFRRVSSVRRCAASRRPAAPAPRPGQATAAAPPITPRNSRRLMTAPASGESIISAQTSALIGPSGGFEHGSNLRPTQINITSTAATHTPLPRWVTNRPVGRCHCWVCLYSLNRPQARLLPREGLSEPTPPQRRSAPIEYRYYWPGLLALLWQIISGHGIPKSLFL